MTPPTPPFQCPRRVGFLFPHACQRETPLGCPDCQNGQIEDPYLMRDRYYYSRYDYYDDYYYNDYYGDSYSTGYASPDESIGMGVAGAQGDAAAQDFTEADGADMVKPDDDFENDMTGS